MMFAAMKRWIGKKDEKHQGFHRAQQWKENVPLQRCFAALRGSFTVAQAYHQEAVEAAVRIAVSEACWKQTEAVPGDFLPRQCYLLWNDGALPVLLCGSEQVLDHLREVTAVSDETFLVSETMDRIIHCKNHSIFLYSIA